MADRSPRCVANNHITLVPAVVGRCESGENGPCCTFQRSNEPAETERAPAVAAAGTAHTHPLATLPRGRRRRHGDCHSTCSAADVVSADLAAAYPAMKGRQTFPTAASVHLCPALVAARTLTRPRRRGGGSSAPAAMPPTRPPSGRRRRARRRDVGGAGGGRRGHSTRPCTRARAGSSAAQTEKQRRQRGGGSYLPGASPPTRSPGGRRRRARRRSDYGAGVDVSCLLRRRPCGWPTVGGGAGWGGGRLPTDTWRCMGGGGRREC